MVLLGGGVWSCYEGCGHSQTISSSQCGQNMSGDPNFDAKLERKSQVKMDDIEDLGLNEFNLPQAVRKEHVLPKVLRRKVGRVLEEPKGGNIPGLGCIFLKTWGCAHNTSDGEYMAGLLADYGYGLTQGTVMHARQEQLMVR